MEESRERNRKSLLAAPTFFQERGERNRKSLLVDHLSDLEEARESSEPKEWAR